MEKEVKVVDYAWRTKKKEKSLIWKGHSSARISVDLKNKGQEAASHDATGCGN